MKRIKVTLQGTLTYFAERTFEVEVNDDQTLTTVSPNTLNELADFNQVPWSFSECGHIEPTDFTVEDCDEPKTVENDSIPQMENQPTT
jgi:hypothetical protein